MIYLFARLRYPSCKAVARASTSPQEDILENDTLIAESAVLSGIPIAVSTLL